jgi:hypothetical protein
MPVEPLRLGDETSDNRWVHLGVRRGDFDENAALS